MAKKTKGSGLKAVVIQIPRGSQLRLQDDGAVEHKYPGREWELFCNADVAQAITRLVNEHSKPLWTQVSPNREPGESSVDSRGEPSSSHRFTGY